VTDTWADIHVTGQADCPAKSEIASSREAAPGNDGGLLDSYRKADRLLSSLAVRHLGPQPYEPIWRAMQNFTAQRSDTTPDELWLLEHLPVYTLGQAGDPRHLLRDNGIPLLRTDRGGQITYHGPGQLVAYVLVDLRRRGLMVRQLVSLMEQAVIDLMAGYGIRALRRAGAPGAYVGSAKVAALGLRVRRSCSYHGLSLNIDMDLSPFAAINPCGYSGLAVTQLRDLGVVEPPATVAAKLARHLVRAIEEATPDRPNHHGHGRD
jgi:lipoyl(octanoyl) transferase